MAEKRQGLSREEIAAMKEALRERNSKQDGESAIKAAIAKMPGADRAMGKRLHEIVGENAPNLIPRTWYGMPAYSDKEGNVILFFRSGAKFKERYMTLGFNNEARLDEGRMWPIVYALTSLTASEEKRIAELVRKAVST